MAIYLYGLYGELLQWMGWHGKDHTRGYGAKKTLGTNNNHLSSEPALISARMSLTSGNLKAHSMIFKQEIVGTYMWVRHDVRMTPPPKDIMAEKTATVLWNNWLKKFLKPGPVLLLSFSSSPIELLPGAVDQPRSKQMEL